MDDFGAVDDLFTMLVKPLLLGAPRAMAMLLVFPLLPGDTFPRHVRNGVALALLLPVYPLLRAALPEAPASPHGWLFFLLKESAVGASIGWSFAGVIWAFETLGALLDIQTGLSSAETFDPASGTSIAVYARALRETALVLFVALGGLLIMTGALHRSYLAWPVTQAFPRSAADVHASFSGVAGQVLTLGMSLALPLLVLLLLIELGMGLLNRTLPQLNVFSLSMPLKVLGAGIACALSLSYYVEVLQSQLWRHLQAASPV